MLEPPAEPLQPATLARRAAAEGGEGTAAGPPVALEAAKAEAAKEEARLSEIKRRAEGAKAAEIEAMRAKDAADKAAAGEC